MHSDSTQRPTKPPFAVLPDEVEGLDDAERTCWVQAYNDALDAGASPDEAGLAGWRACLRRRDEQEQDERRRRFGYDPRLQAAGLLRRLAEREGGSVEQALRYLERHHRELVDDVRRVWRMTD